MKSFLKGLVYENGEPSLTRVLQVIFSIFALIGGWLHQLSDQVVIQILSFVIGTKAAQSIVRDINSSWRDSEIGKPPTPVKKNPEGV